jgi:hypothetical protein
MSTRHARKEKKKENAQQRGNKDETYGQSRRHTCATTTIFFLSPSKKEEEKKMWTKESADCLAKHFYFLSRLFFLKCLENADSALILVVVSSLVSTPASRYFS